MTCPSTIIYNGTGVLGELLCGLTNNVTGSLFFSLLLIVIGFIVIMFMFRIPLEFQGVLLLPFLLTLMAYTQEFLAIGGIVLIILSAAVARSWSRF